MLVASVFGSVVLLIVSFGVAVEKSSALSSVALRCRYFSWSSMDLFFASVHSVPDGEPLRSRRTMFGATMTLAALIAFAGAGVVLGFNSVQFPNYVTSVSPQPAPWQPSGTFELSAKVYGGGLDHCENTQGSGIGIFAQPSEWSAAPTRISNRFNYTDGSCLVIWRCEGKCTMLALETATLQLRSPTRSWASAVTFTVTTPLFVKETVVDDTFVAVPFQISASFYASLPSTTATNDTYFAMRGTSATQVQISLSPHVLMDSNGKYISVAFEPSLLGISYGDVTSFSTFDFSSPDGFAISFLLTRSSLSLVLYDFLEFVFLISFQI
jgi:hypothetical protein